MVPAASKQGHPALSLASSLEKDSNGAMSEKIGTGTPSDHVGLKRAVGAPLLFAFIVGDTLGAGIYTLVGSMSADVGGVIWLPLLIALVVALLTAGTYAELITKYPHAGGAARYAERAFKVPYVSFLVGFLMMASGITTAAALANAFAGDYLAALIDVPAAPAAVVFIILLTLINLRGVKESLGANLVASIIEVTGLVLVIVVAAIVLGSGNGEPARLLGSNDTPRSAEPIDRFGTGNGKAQALTVVGNLARERVDIDRIRRSREDDGAIPLARATGLGISRQGIRLSGRIGDGPHGESGTGSGDVD